MQHTLERNIEGPVTLMIWRSVKIVAGTTINVLRTWTRVLVNLRTGPEVGVGRLSRWRRS